MEDNNLSKSNNSTVTWKNKKPLIIGGLATLILVIGGAWYFFYTSQEMEPVLNDTLAQTQVEQIQIEWNEQEIDIASTSEENDTASKRDADEKNVQEEIAEIDPSLSVWDAERSKINSNNDLTDEEKVELLEKIDKEEKDADNMEDVINDSSIDDLIDWEELDAEEEKLTSLLKNLKEKEAAKEIEWENSIQNPVEVEDVSEKIIINDGSIHISTEFILYDEVSKTFSLSDKWMKTLSIEDNSVILDLVLDNLNNHSNSYTDKSFIFKSYELTIDSLYNISKVKKNGIEDLTSSLLWLSIFEIDNLYKTR